MPKVVGAQRQSTASDSRAQGHASTNQLIAGRYRVERALGEGGAAQVLCVTDVSRGAKLALKRLDPRAGPKQRTLFELEFHTLASLSHPQIVRVFDFGRDDEAVFYTMELLEGTDLRDRAPLPWREACAYIHDAAQALALLHARRLVHRDVSTRNLWRTPDGRVKLIDFGALAPFGASTHIIGTPPFVAPEALDGATLDQRTDLYSLGAVAYYLLTGSHAYPARTLSDLHALFRAAPAPPSELVANLARSDLPAVPPELDELVKAMLSQSPLGRPDDSAEVLDRLETLLGGHERPSFEGAARAHLASPVFVGRQSARRRLSRLLTLATGGRGQSCIVESEPGLGRTRILRELALEAQIGSATVLHVEATSSSTRFSAASALASSLLDALPAVARVAATPFLARLSTVSQYVRERLGAADVARRDEERVAVQAALRDWVLAVAKEHTLVILVDGLEQVDDSSLAVLLGLAEARLGARLLLVCTVAELPGRVAGVAERLLREASRSVTLGPLNDAETLELLRSVFGNADNLERLALRLRSATRGNPGHMLELCAQWALRDVIGFVDGTWVLPREVPGHLLSSSREQALCARLDLLGPGARELARVLSLHDEECPLELVAALAQTTGDGSLADLPELLDHAILLRDERGVRFANEELRRTLSAELSPSLRRAAQLALGGFLLEHAGDSALAKLRAAVHLFACDDPRAAPIVTEAAVHITLHEADNIKLAAAMTEVAVSYLRGRGRPARELVAPLALLSSASFSAEQSYAGRYGDATVDAFRETLGLALAPQLRRYVGARLSILLTLVVAGVRLHKHRADRRVPSFKDLLGLLFASVAALTGACAACLDADNASRYAQVLAPFAGLGRRHIAGFMAVYCKLVAQLLRDLQPRTWREWHEMLPQLETPRGVRGLSDSLRRRFLGGALYSLGAIESQRDGDAALSLAARLDSDIDLAIYLMSADQVRTLYYANQGNLEQAEHYRVRVDHHAAQQGSSWQVEMWTCTATLSTALRTHDAMLMKHAAEELSRMSQQVPSLDRSARRARGAYLLLRGSYAKALPWLEEVLENPPRATLGWGRMCGTLAHCYNKLGQHERALATCELVYQHFGEAELSFSPLTSQVQTERLIAQAALGQGNEAFARLDALIARHAPQHGPLTLGALHDAGVTLARLLNDRAREEAHFAQLEHWYMSTNAPSLVQYCAVRRREVWRELDTSGAVKEGDSPHTSVSSGNRPLEGVLTVDRMLAGGTLSFAERSHKALQILAEHTRSSSGLLFVLEDNTPRLVASLRPDESMSPEVEAWSAAQLARELDDPDTEIGEVARLQTSSDVLAGARWSHRALLLLDARAGEHGVVGMAVLGSDNGEPRPCPRAVLNAVAYNLQRAREQQPAVRPSVESLER